jgi:hypothetical protein
MSLVARLSRILRKPLGRDCERQMGPNMDLGLEAEEWV